MEYASMLSDTGLVSGLKELLSDGDTTVVKRSIRLFTRAYQNCIRLVSTGELDAKGTWEPANEVVDRLLAMLVDCHHEGLLLHLIRFAEVAVTAHLFHPLTQYVNLCDRGKTVVREGLRSLKNLVGTPYVGGGAFILTVRALISIACLREDLWEPVTELISRYSASPPPTLFDHHVRSLRKTLQRHLFRILRRAQTPSLKSKLIEVMVRVGVPRKDVLPWAPFLNSKPRSVMDQVTKPPIKPVVEPKMEASQVENPRSKKAGLNFLTSLLPPLKPATPDPDVPTWGSDPEERKNYDALDIKTVVNLVLKNVDAMPDKAPEDFIETFKAKCTLKSIEDMRKKLSTLFTEYFKNPPQSIPRSTPVMPESAQVISKSTTVPLGSRDVDMRAVSSGAMDVDMRRDPRIQRKLDRIPQRLDPRLHRASVAPYPSIVTPVENISRDPRLRQC